MERQKRRQDAFHQTCIRNGHDRKTSYRQGNPVVKPACVLLYNKGMGGVDRSDQLASTCRVVRKTTRWYKKLFFYMFGIAIVNTYLIFRKACAQANDMALPHFKNLLARQMPQSGTINAYQKRGRPRSLPTPNRLQARHGYFFELIPQTGGKNVAYRRCTVCLNHDMRKEMKFQCDICKLPLCPAPCFKSFQTIVQF